ncbi:potassium channel family protein [Halanaerobium praevalens]|uniref:TrkA-N domain protein n=1 Tax=Halanaerobium praevalens (strain ATCC 33744 / DSM 2228 / GSL) TaxID=572479 RepID=E3DNB0_HALPG|nr:NAD-binding protein [Halanaerobium praevalens]ADO77529.1 TrkA-N domain protein [Halanaerobium praevalens DSM 2228]
MFIVIIGCGRTGSLLAGNLSRSGHEVVVIENNAESFSLLPVDFSGFQIEGDAAENDILKEGKIESADLVIVSTGNDQINYLVSQMAKINFDVPRIMVRTIDPAVEKMYKNENKVESFSQISLLADNMISKIEQEGMSL